MFDPREEHGTCFECGYTLYKSSKPTVMFKGGEKEVFCRDCATKADGWSNTPEPGGLNDGREKSFVSR